MIEYSVPSQANPVARNLTDLVRTNALEEPERAVFSRKVDGLWQEVTAREFLDQVTALARGLIASGIDPGDRVALMSRTRYEWTLCDFAIWFAGAVTVPIYETSSAEQVEWILGDSGARACFLETPAHHALQTKVADATPDVQHVWVFEENGLDDLASAGVALPISEVEQRCDRLTRESLATIIYTSGTTGRPKGCELTHGNLLFGVANAVAALGPLFGKNSSTLLFLPLAHVFARIIEIGYVMARTRMGHSADIPNLLPDLAAFRPTFLLAVPRVFEKIYNTTEQRAQAAGKGRIFRFAVDTAIAYSRALDAGRPGMLLRARHGVFDRLVFSKLRQALGGRAEWAVSGGAPLGPRLGHFFRGAGITILEGYGLTETTAAAAANTPAHLRVGTVGRPLPGTTVRIADDGEVLVRGGHVFRGYHGNPEATAEVLHDGWLHTGDLGALDADGYLTITGRKKEMLVTAGGKNVAPAVLEDRLRAHPLISQCVVVGDARPYIGALITLDGEFTSAWLAARGRPDRPVSQLVDDEAVVADVQAAVDAANRAVSRAEAIRRFRILPVDFTEEGGQLTPSLKLKRGVVMEQFASDVAALYS